MSLGLIKRTQSGSRYIKHAYLGVGNVLQISSSYEDCITECCVLEDLERATWDRAGLMN